MIVFFDIDGTIVDNKTQQIPQSAMDAVAALGQNGHLAVVNTGRPYSHIDPRVRKMAFGGWISGCGMDVILNGQHISYVTPDPALCQFVKEQVRRWDMRVLYEADDGSVALDGPFSNHPTFYRESMEMANKGFAVNCIDDHPRFMKFITCDGPNSRRKEFLQAMSPYFTSIDRGDTMLEHVPIGCTKAGGMKILMDALGVSREDTLAIGDSTNDLPMFAASSHTVCMGNGMEELKQQAEYITASVMEDGVAKALRHFGLIG